MKIKIPMPDIYVILSDNEIGKVKNDAIENKVSIKEAYDNDEGEYRYQKMKNTTFKDIYDKFKYKKCAITTKDNCTITICVDKYNDSILRILFEDKCNDEFYSIIINSDTETVMIINLFTEDDNENKYMDSSERVISDNLNSLEIYPIDLIDVLFELINK